MSEITPIIQITTLNIKFNNIKFEWIKQSNPNTETVRFFFNPRVRFIKETFSKTNMPRTQEDENKIYETRTVNLRAGVAILLDKVHLKCV